MKKSRLLRAVALTLCLALVGAAGLAEAADVETCAVEAPVAEVAEFALGEGEADASDAEVMAPDAPATDDPAANTPATTDPAANTPATADPAADTPVTTDPAADASDANPLTVVQTVALTRKKASAQMNIDETLQIAVNAGETGTFKSKSAKLATVDENGLVKALAKGTAKIEFKPDGGKKRTLSIRIVDPYEPTGVSIAQGGAMTLNVGDVFQLNAVLSPDTARTTLTWKSGKPKVVAVEGDGVLKAVGEGKTKLTVTTANKKKATITVTVVNPYKPSGVSIDLGNALTLLVGESAQLGAVLAPDTARTTLTWKSSKSKVATVDANGLVTAVGRGKSVITVKTDNKLSAALELKVIDISDIPRSPAMNTATYNGVEFNVVNTVVDPFVYAGLVCDRICTSPGRTGKYHGYCLGFCNYYVSCMVDNITNVDISVALRKYMTSKKLRYATEKYGNPDAMMARLYDLVNAGAPQILMVEAVTRPGSRHFVVVVGYRSSVTRREDLRPEDLLIIDSFDGKLESMDPAIEPVETRVLFKQKGKYRIEAVSFRS